MSDLIARIGHQRVIPVLRSATPELAFEVATTLYEAGAGIVELTQSTPDVLVAVRRLASRGVCVGLGTVRHADEIAPAADAGASFVVSFAHPPGFVNRCASLRSRRDPGRPDPAGGP